MKRYKIVEGGLHDRFHNSRAKVQFIGGGYGNGKTAASSVKALRLARDYPGSNGLVARETYPKLNDTIRKELISWCPKEWIKRMPTKDENSLYLTNGSIINFRYVAQKGKETEQSTSNLLSATYDWMLVDQIEDPGFTHKDFMDLMGRLRGNTAYIGDDPTMPKYGPRWFMVTSNPTRNWVFRELIKPLHDFAKGIYNPKLLCVVGSDGRPKHDENGKPIPLIELFEGSTYENVENVGEDYIQGMLSSFTNDSMRKRFIFGQWGALSGLVYSTFDEQMHVLDDEVVEDYLKELRLGGFKPTLIEGYDHGLIEPSCYGLYFGDDDGNVFLLDGFYERELPISDGAQKIRELRVKYGFDADEGEILSDPALFRRSAGTSKQVGITVAEIFAREGVQLVRGNNDIASGIAKNGQYLVPNIRHEHPLYGTPNSPHFYISRRNSWFIDEISDYIWKSGNDGTNVDKPTDRKDHAMDMWKYAMTHRPKLAKFVGKPNQPPAWMSWHEVQQSNSGSIKPRHK